MESSGTDLTIIFPGVSNVKLSRKRPQREQLARYVKGLEPYRGSSQYLSTNPPPSIEIEEACDEQWWRNKDAFRINNGTSTESRIDDGDETEGDDEFQVRLIPTTDTRKLIAYQTQATPTYLLGRQNDDSTDDDDLDAPVHRGKRLGVIGKKRQMADPAQTKADHRTATRRNTVTPEPDITHVTPEPDKPMSSPAETPRKAEASQFGLIASQAPLTPSKRRLGIIGGRNKSQSQSASQFAPDEPSLPEERIGSLPPLSSPMREPSQSVSRSSPPPAMHDSRGRSRSREASLAPRETSQERADRKRQELKHQLEEKVKAPTKKRRRF
ncbi:hypothetical protein H2203_006941 [Taxawa tesnikishii (nom. ined.)]|nr:hypothetical protein H2203_006941 [Dothideales sp. JES 119]